jgi:hypothetical protein
VTRRTPKPGDSYSKGNVTVVVDDVWKDEVYVSTWRDGYMRFDELKRLPLAVFHAAIEADTWGRG